MSPYRKISTRLKDEIFDLADQGTFDTAAEKILNLHPADQAKLYQDLPGDQQKQLLSHLEIGEIADLFDELDDQETFTAAQKLPVPFLADIIDDMDPDEAADLLGDLSGQDVRRTISLMEDPEDVLPLLRYPDETAGGRMTTDFLVLEPGEKASQAIEYLRNVGPDSDVPYYLFVVDEEGRLAGVTGLRERSRSTHPGNHGHSCDQHRSDARPGGSGAVDDPL